MQFKVVKRNGVVNARDSNTVLLTWNSWNDYSFLTLFGVLYYDDNFKKHDLGSVRIGYYGQGTSERRLTDGDEFETIAENFFSLGVGTEYYDKIRELGAPLRAELLGRLRDIAFDPEIFQLAQHEEVTQISLMRGIDAATVTGQYRRMAMGGAKLTEFRFKFHSPKITSDSPEMKLGFNVIPESNPPSNVHVVIGRNGVGKTTLIQNMLNSLYEDEGNTNSGVYFRDDDGKFVNVVQVSFSAFDSEVPKFDVKSEWTGIQFKYIGLKAPDKDLPDGFSIKTTSQLGQEFMGSFWECIESFKKVSLKNSLLALESDPNFKEADITRLLEFSKKDFQKEGLRIFGKLSSGHKIILLSITRLIETVQEKTLIFIDEPEAHLHPPLLSAFTRALSELLMSINGVAIVATHSPVILQEVPKSCVYKLQRHGAIASAIRPEIETFGENVGVLTREIFGLEVTDSGFYQLLKKAVVEEDSYDHLLERFGDQLGMEGRAMARVLFSEKQNKA